MNNVAAVILAGGKGSRLEPLTRDRAKPAVPFGGIYRIIDFALSNCLNSGIRNLFLLTQYKAMSLDRHVNQGWRRYFCEELGEFIEVVPPQQRIDEHWYQGTADAVYQNIYSIERIRPDYVVILAGDHIYRMNYQEMLQNHIAEGAELSIAALPVTVEQAKSFGVMQINEQRVITGFEEKPAFPKTIPGSSDTCLASMGIYIFSARVLFEVLCQDANLPDSSHDFGRDIIPTMIHTHKVLAYPFQGQDGKAPYWRDVGTLDAYYQASMDLVSVQPQLNVYDRDWPIRTWQPDSPPPKFVFGSKPSSPPETSNMAFPKLALEVAKKRIGCALDSIVCAGTIVSGTLVERSIIGRNVVMRENGLITDSIIFDNVRIGKNVTIKSAIIDKDVEVPDNTKIGVNKEEDRRRGYVITDNGVTVIAKAERISNTPVSSMKLKSWHVNKNRVTNEKR